MATSSLIILIQTINPNWLKTQNKWSSSPWRRLFPIKPFLCEFTFYSFLLNYYQLHFCKRGKCRTKFDPGKMYRSHVWKRKLGLYDKRSAIWIFSTTSSLGCNTIFCIILMKMGLGNFLSNVLCSLHVGGFVYFILAWWYYVFCHGWNVWEFFCEIVGCFVG